MSELSQDLGIGWSTTSSVAVLRQLAAGAALREDPGVLVQRLFLAVAEQMGLNFFIHYRYPGAGQEMDLASTGGVGDHHLDSLATMVLGEAVCGKVAETRTPMAYADVDRREDDRLALAASLGARSYVSYPLLDGAELLGTLSFGSRTRASLTDPELDVLRLATDLVAAAAAHHRDHAALDRVRGEVTAMADTIEQLRTALDSRDEIARVKGMLMMRLGITDDAAWQLMVRLSQTTNRRVRDVAPALGAHLLDGAVLPEDLRSRLPGGLSGRGWR
jgi:GAF domain-containing protein